MELPDVSHGYSRPDWLMVDLRPRARNGEHLRPVRHRSDTDPDLVVLGAVSIFASAWGRDLSVLTAFLTPSARAR